MYILIANHEEAEKEQGDGGWEKKSTRKERRRIVTNTSKPRDEAHETERA